MSGCELAKPGHRVVGNFIMFVAGCLQHGHAKLEKAGVCVCILEKFTTRMAQKEVSVLLVRETISRDVLRLQVHRSLQRKFPLLDSLAGQTEHEIDIDVHESGESEKFERLLRLLRIVFASQQLQQFIIPGLNSQANPRYAKFVEKCSLASRHASRICLDGPFNKRREIKPLMKCVEQEL